MGNPNMGAGMANAGMMPGQNPNMMPGMNRQPTPNAQSMPIPTPQPNAMSPAPGKLSTPISYSLYQCNFDIGYGQGQQQSQGMPSAVSPAQNQVSNSMNNPNAISHTQPEQSLPQPTRSWDLGNKLEMF